MNFPFHETLFHYSRSDRNLILHFQNFGSPNLTSKFSFGLEGTQLLIKHLQKALITLDHQKSWIFAHHLLLWGNDFLQPSWSIVKWNFSTQPAKSFYGFLIELYCSLHVLDIKKFRESTAFCTFGKRLRVSPGARLSSIIKSHYLAVTLTARKEAKYVGDFYGIVKYKMLST